VPKARISREKVHPPSLLGQIIERLRGRDQRMVTAGDRFPMLLLDYPKGGHTATREIEFAYTRVLPSLPPAVTECYDGMFPHLPALVVVILRPLNTCTCLGHHHPEGTESRLTRRLAGEMKSTVGEIDLAYEGIRTWRPQPLSTLAAGDMAGKFAELHFQAGVLAVLLHELDHLAFPEKAEREIRTGSNQFYEAVMSELVSREGGTGFGMSA
jgi:hypothetical protein